MSWIARLLAHPACGACEAWRAQLEAARRDEESAQTAAAAAVRERDEAFAAVNAATARLEILARIERATGVSGDEAHGVVLAWRASHQHLQETQRALVDSQHETAVLRRQLHSVALQSMSTVDMLRVPVTDPEPRKPSSN